MRSLSLRSRLLLWASAASALTLVLVIALVDVTFRANIRDELVDGLTLARQVVESARAGQLNVHITEAATLALDTRLRAAVATADPATISQTLGEVFSTGPGSWAMLVGTNGAPIAATARAPDLESADAGGLVNEALFADTGDLWALDGVLVEVAASALFFGAEPLGVLIIGRPLDGRQVGQLESAVGRPVVVLANGRSTLGPEAQMQISGDGRAALEGWHGVSGDQVELLALGTERFYAAAMPLVARTGERRGSVVLLGSYDQALAPSNALRVGLIAIFVFGLSLTFGVVAVFSRAITVPVGRLLRETERLGHGDLEHPIVPLREDEIGRLAESFDEMRVSLKVARSELIRAERLSAIGKAASAVAHDFTQPLSTIAGAVGLLRLDSSPEVRDRCFVAIEGELERLQRMKQEIVEFARGESSLDEAEVRIDSFLENTVSAQRLQLAQRDIRLAIEHGYTGDWYIDSYRLERVVENLVRNAAAAISSSGSIVLRSSMSGEALVLEVEDDGPGVPPDRVDEIFEPFVSFGKKEGTGLGLAIARNVVRQHGGTIDVTSQPGRTRFRIVVPRRRKPAVQRHAAAVGSAS